MKNFLDLQDINTNLSVCVELSPHGSPLSTNVSLNGVVVFDGKLDKKFSYICDIGILESLNLLITVSGKDYNIDSEPAVVIDKITIDELNLIPNCIHLSSYVNDQQYVSPTTHLGFNGTWQFSISDPFYTWRHKTLNFGWLLSPERI